ncbi:hypothetical protein [Streptomyces sp. JNUCC 63]
MITHACQKAESRVAQPVRQFASGSGDSASIHELEMRNRSISAVPLPPRGNPEYFADARTGRGEAADDA